MKDWNQTRSCQGEINVMKLYHWLQIILILGTTVVKQQITFRATELIPIPLLCPNSISPISQLPLKLETRLCGQRGEDG